MKQIKLIKYGSIVLLLGNIALICYLFFGRPPHPEHPTPKDVIIERLGFDASQIKSYEAAITIHRKGIQQKQGALRNLKKNILADLKSDGKCEINDSLLQKFTELQSEIEQAHFMHFCEIKAICKPNQLKKFDLLVDELDRLFAPHHPPPPPGK